MIAPRATLIYYYQIYLLSRSKIWWSLAGSNRWPPACKAGALPAELRPRSYIWCSFNDGPCFFLYKHMQSCICVETTRRIFIKDLLVAELRPQSRRYKVNHMVGLSGLEPPTSRLSGVRSNQLSYRPSFQLRYLFLQNWTTKVTSFSIVATKSLAVD